MNLKQFTTGYITAALWSSVDDNGEPLDAIHAPEDLPEQTRQAMENDCRKFFEENNDALWEYQGNAANKLANLANVRGHTIGEHAGHDFWLTRCGHGAGFWDRGMGELGDKLSNAAEAFGNVDLYVGDDGKVYQGSAE